ncbi:hypothetical protein NG821_12275, partial [Prevotella cerevisiae]
YCIACQISPYWGLLAPKLPGVFRYRLFHLTNTQELHFYIELAYADRLSQDRRAESWIEVKKN